MFYQLLLKNGGIDVPIISITELSVTERNLKKISADISEKLETALNLACTEDTKKAVKKYRAELSKQFAEFEAERKEKTAEYEKPLKEFKAMYDEYIAVPFKRADQALKQKIDEVEKVQKDAKREAVENYARELIQAYALDWLDASRIIPNVILSASEKSLKKAVKDAADKIKSEVDCINAISDNAELMAEYMKCLNLAQAKLTVVERQHAIEQAEKARSAYIQQEEIYKEAEKKIEQLAPPTVETEQEEKTYQMTFTVNGTIEQLKALKAFMIENNINFTNGGN